MAGFCFKLEPTLNAFVTRTPEIALEAARAADEALAAGMRQDLFTDYLSPSKI